MPTPSPSEDATKAALVEKILHIEAPLGEGWKHLASLAKLGPVPGIEAAAERFAARKLALSAMTPEALQEVLAAKLKEKARADEAKRFYNQPQARADYTHWLSLDFWTLEESVALLTGRDPRHVNKEAIDADLAPQPGLLAGPANPPTGYTKFFAALLHTAEHSEDMTRSQKLRPVEVIRWAAPLLQDRLPEQLSRHLAKAPASAEASLSDRPEAAEPLQPQRTMVKRAALISMSEAWPTVVSDFQHAKENGLHVAAKAPAQGMWWKEPALDWAERHGKLKRPTGIGHIGGSFIHRI